MSSHVARAAWTDEAAAAGAQEERDDDEVDDITVFRRKCSKRVKSTLACLSDQKSVHGLIQVVPKQHNKTNIKTDCFLPSTRIFEHGQHKMD